MQLRVTTARNSLLLARDVLAGLGVPLLLFSVLVVTGRAEQPGATTLDVKGVVQAGVQTDLYARIPSFASSVKVDIGDHVKRGQVLVELFAPELDAELNLKQAQVAQAEINVKLARHAVQVSEAAMRRNVALLEEAKAALGSSRANLERWRADLARTQKLVEAAAIDKATFDEVRAQVQAGESKITEAQSRIDRAQAQVVEGEALRDKAQTDVRAAEAGVAVARADMDRVATLLEYKHVRAPFDGMVLNRFVNPGELVGLNEKSKVHPLFTLVDVATVRVVIQIPEASALAVKPGTPAIVHIPTIKGSKLSGKVSRTICAIDPKTGTMTAEIDLPNPDSRLYPGMNANVQLQVEERK
jgi:HlyD family secretion protein